MEPVLARVEGYKGQWLVMEPCKSQPEAYWCLRAASDGNGGHRPSYEGGWRAFRGSKITEVKPRRPVKKRKRKPVCDEVD